MDCEDGSLMFCARYQVIEFHRVGIVESFFLMMSDNDGNWWDISGNKWSKSSVVCVLLRARNKNIGARTWWTSICSGQVGLYEFDVVGGGGWGDARMLYTVIQVSRQHTATGSIQMNAIGSEKISPLPEDIKIVNEADIVGAAGWGEPCVQTEQPAEVNNSSATVWGGAGVTNTHRGLWELIKKLCKILF